MPETNKIETVNITPNYENLFSMYSQDFVLNAKSLSNLPVRNHEDVQVILASFSVALAAITNQENLDKLRDLLQKVVEESRENLSQKQDDEFNREKELESEFYR